MSTFTLAISCLTTSNLPWFMDLTFQVPTQYFSYSIRPCFYHQSHPQLGIVFALAPSIHSFIQGCWCRKESLKGVTERNPSGYHFSWSQSWELHAALLVPGIETDRSRRFMRNSEQHAGILLLNVPWHEQFILQPIFCLCNFTHTPRLTKWLCICPTDVDIC